MTKLLILGIEDNWMLLEWNESTKESDDMRRRMDMKTVGNIVGLFIILELEGRIIFDLDSPSQLHQSEKGQLDFSKLDWQCNVVGQCVCTITTP